jgi:hypothetical protein
MTSDTLIHNTWVGKALFFYGFGLITHKTSKVGVMGGPKYLY